MVAPLTVVLLTAAVCLALLGSGPATGALLLIAFINEAAAAWARRPVDPEAT